jgi:hypothetical protein
MLQVGALNTGIKIAFIPGTYNIDGLYLSNATGNGGAKIELAAHSTGSTSQSWRIQHDSDAAVAALSFGYSAAASTYAGLSYTERARFDNSGHFMVGTTSTDGAATNTTRLIGGIHATVRSSASVASGTPTTLVTLPAGDGIYIVTAALQNSSTPGSYNETAIVSISQSTASIAILVNPYNLNLSMFGLNLLVTHTQGATQTIQFSVLRLL